MMWKGAFVPISDRGHRNLHTSYHLRLKNRNRETYYFTRAKKINFRCVHFFFIVRFTSQCYQSTHCLKIVPLRNEKSDKMSFINFLPDYCCGGRTRTCDLQVMSLASYQLLHTAINQLIFELRVQRYKLFMKQPNFSPQNRCYLTVIKHKRKILPTKCYFGYYF